MRPTSPRLSVAERSGVMARSGLFFANRTVLASHLITSVAISRPARAHRAAPAIGGTRKNRLRKSTLTPVFLGNKLSLIWLWVSISQEHQDRLIALDGPTLLVGGRQARCLPGAIAFTQDQHYEIGLAHASQTRNLR